MNIYDEFKKVKNASLTLMHLKSEKKDNVLKKIADLIDKSREKIKSENQKDIENGKRLGLNKALIDRLLLNDKRIDSMISGVMDIVAQDDPVGMIDRGFKRPNGLKIYKVRVPIGVIGIIYESRPNVTVDAAALCLKSGNASILRGGKEALNSNRILGDIIKEALVSEGLDDNLVYILEDPERKYIMDMLKAKDYIDLIIPRGGEGLIKFVTENSFIPVVKHDKGVCHTYIDKDADLEKAVKIAVNAKVQRPGVCNAMETLLIHKDVADEILPRLKKEYDRFGVELRGCEKVRNIIDINIATEEDWEAEYLDLILSVKVVESDEEAIEHINKYGSSHSESIVTENYTTAQKFLESVDAAAVYVNASTRFTDGAEFGLGAEIGISTQKLHCRGPMGAYDLTTTKYIVYGDGHIRE
ncbi:glutamate-5-semialdehyde dehydrogenase [Deferribacter desulfuricans SSM1]|uniref:Gamma-glutamyl phosphate reductase n=1 Tax=Deferribacter desulfuricans (strain DSM 14783 / JCM 11476 / NBRC 101012 / SSM1) TaxID=639282 RepID=D3PE20_DEFDS|nr:glutamate-5-semialdehyde dehydrogenase [Deferribacter desulfuricans]BAI80843.1 glutamate-5-semialdehyde dehydrogenase [Deferribacter desulfuricans SSM1]